MAPAQPPSGSRSKAAPKTSPPHSEVEMEQEEVARRLRLTVDQVRKAEQSGLRKLRSMLEALGVTATMVAAAFNPDRRRPADRPPTTGVNRLLRRLFISGGGEDCDGEGSDG